MSEVLIIEHGLSMRKIYNVLFRGSTLYFAKTSQEIIQVYRVKRPNIVLILSNDPKDVELVNLVKLLNPSARIIWISPDTTLGKRLGPMVDASFTPPFPLDEFILKFEELRKPAPNAHV